MSILLWMFLAVCDEVEASENSSADHLKLLFQLSLTYRLIQ